MSGAGAKGTRRDYKALRELPIQSVAKALGFSVRPRGSARCPFPDHPDRDPSFQVWTRSNRFECFGCHRKGSPIDLVMAHQTVDRDKACDWLEERFLRNGSPPLAPAREAVEEIQPRCAADPEVYEHLLEISPLQDRGRAYLAQRRIQAAAVRAGVAELVDARRALKGLFARFDEARVLACGLARTGDDGQIRLAFKPNSLLIPFRLAGACLFMQGRSMLQLKRGRWLGPDGVSAIPFNLDALDTHGPIYICEGATDALSAAELGRNAIGLAGANARLDGRWLHRLVGRDVHVVPDNDAAGRFFAAAVHDQLVAHGIDVIVKRLPPGVKDVNDYLRKRASA